MAINTLYDYYSSKGEALPSVQERAKLASTYGIASYAGTADQNGLLLSKLLASPTGAPVAPAVPGAPVAPVAPPALDPYAVKAKSAGAAGLGLQDLSTIFGASGEDTQTSQDTLAKQFGYQSFADFTNEMFAKPSKTTQQFYEEAYRAAGLDTLLNDVATRRSQVAQAQASLSDNPWLSEASLSGRQGRLRDKTESTIQNLLEDYKLRVNKVNDLVAMHATDVGADDRMKELRFNYLLKAAEDAAARSATSRLGTYLPSYLEGKKNPVGEAPKTLTIGDTAYQFEPVAREWKVIASNPKEVSDGLTPYQRFQATQDLQKNLQRYTQGARDTERQFSVMETAYNRYASGEAKDLNATSQTIITTFNKILDPTSVVRETEYARSPEGQSLLDSLSGRISALSQGGPGLTPTSLKEFVDLARIFVTNAKASIEQSQQLAARNAEAFGLDSSLLGLPGASSGTSSGSVSLDSWANF